MDNNRREHTRIPVHIEIKISHPKIGERIVQTRDFSEGGLFIVMDTSELPMMGELVDGQVQGGENAPIVKMKVVRVEKTGVGLQYVVENLPTSSIWLQRMRLSWSTIWI